MSRIRVLLNNVKCNDTEDVAGADEFYLAGAVTDGEHTLGVLTKPISINDGQTKNFSTGGGVVFDKEVPDNRVLKVILTAWDEDSNKDWSKYGKMVESIGSEVSKGLAMIPNPYTVVASAILPFAIGAVGKIMSMDKDDKLGKFTGDFPVWALANGENQQIWSFKGGGGWYSSWKYSVRFTIIKG